jgi:23S rRNA pseudouridine1911/1915/1917 synthase
VGKRYLALVTGRPEGNFTVDAPLGPVPGKADRQMVDDADGKDATTEVEVLEQFGRHALLACTIRTGRRHQIRVHLTARGLPVAGDHLYGTRAHVALPGGRVRLALHAERLSFDHPRSGERLSFEAPLPPDLSTALSALRSGA